MPELRCPPLRAFFDECDVVLAVGTSGISAPLRTSGGSSTLPEGSLCMQIDIAPSTADPAAGMQYICGDASECLRAIATQLADLSSDPARAAGLATTAAAIHAINTERNCTSNPPRVVLPRPILTDCLWFQGLVQQSSCSPKEATCPPSVQRYLTTLWWSPG